MSIRALSAVLDRYPKGGSEKLVLVTLADWCDDNGGNLYPSIKSIAAKACVEPRQAQRIMHALINDGLLSVVGNENGGSPGTTRKYRLNIKKIEAMPKLNDQQTGVTDDTGDIQDTGVMGDADGCHPRHRRVTSKAETGVMDDTLSINDPLENHQGTVIKGAGEPRRTKTKSSRLPADWVLPEDWAEWTRNETPSINPKTEAEKFGDYWRGRGDSGAIKACWFSTWRNWCRRAAENTRSKPTILNRADAAKAHNDALLASLGQRQVIEGEVIHATR